MRSRSSPFGGFTPLCRISLLVVGVLSLGLLAVAASIQPDRRGWGTHQQLGLPPCTVQEVFGMRCPACGMTTAWAHFMRGNWYTALSCNVGGTALALACVVAIPWTIGTAIRGDWVWLRPTDGQTLCFCLAIMAVTVSDWLIRLALGAK